MSFDKDKKYGEYKNKKYTLKENSVMTYIPNDKYVVHKFVWNDIENKYVIDKNMKISPEDADYVIKDFYYPYEFNMRLFLINKINEKKYGITDEIKAYQMGNLSLFVEGYKIWKKLLTAIAHKQLSFQIITNPNLLIESISSDIASNKYINNPSDIDDAKKYLDLQGYNNFLKFNQLISQQIIQRSQKFQENVIVFSGQSTLYLEKGVSFSANKIDNNVGDIISYYVPISTSTDLSVALTFFMRGVKSNKLLANFGIDKLQDICCVYRYILLPGYPIYNIEKSSYFDTESEILLPCFIKNQINTFKVIDKTIYPIKFNKEWGTLSYQGDKEKYNNALEQNQDPDIILTNITIITCQSLIF